jgi:uncharacterized membrane protein YdjX (TVP38/TMEM64 family)
MTGRHVRTRHSNSRGLIREGGASVNASGGGHRVQTPQQGPQNQVKSAAKPPAPVYRGAVPEDVAISLPRLILLFVFLAMLAAGAFAFAQGGLRFANLVHHRETVAAFVAEHSALAVLAFIGVYVAAAALSIPGSAILTITGGFLFGVLLGAAASVLGATAGATVIFLLARTAVGEPLLKRAGPRAAQLARGFRDHAFSYLLFLRLVPLFPFFLVNLVPAVAGVRLAPFVAATTLGIVPAALIYALAGTGLDSVIAEQVKAHAQCVARREGACPLSFDPRDVLTPQLLAALIGLALLALLPVLVRHYRVKFRGNA